MVVYSSSPRISFGPINILKPSIVTFSVNLKIYIFEMSFLSALLNDRTFYKVLTCDGNFLV